MLGKIKVVLAIIVIFSSFAFAQEAEQAVGNSGTVGPLPTQSQGIMPVQTNTVDFGMPQQSFASPEYVAQEKMIESMTTAYNWISLNSSRFAQGCKEDRSALVSEISNVLSRAQETSTVCSTFASESKSCNPETFCSRFKQGNLPLPANAKIILKKLGYDPDLLKVEDLTVDLISKVCMDQRKSGNEEQTSMLESVKQKIQEQLPEFRKKCELLKQARGRVPEVMLPNIDIRPQAQQNYVAGPSMPQGTGGEQACAEPHPDCYPMPPPQCYMGNWVCGGVGQKLIQEQMPQNQPQPMQQAPQQTTDSSGNIVCPGQAPNCMNGPAAMCQNGNWICPQAQPQPVEQPPTQPQPLEQPPIQPQTQPAPAPAPETSQPATTENPPSATGAVTMGSAVCGNTLCEPDFGENNSNCPQDCTPNAGNNQTMPLSQQQGPQTMPYDKQKQQPQINNFVMPGPEQLCEMTDAEVIDAYTAQMSGGGPSIEEMQYQCSQEAQRELNSMGRYKLEAAKCKADAALDCEAKKQALSSCNEMKSNPEKIAGIIVDSMCRRFGVNASGDSESQLYEVASKWVNSDPALANQLGDTADQASNAKSKLDVISYIFGNGDYAGNLDKKASDLRAIRQRLASSGVNDPETLNALDSQAKEFEAESKQFENLLDFSRLGYLFK